MKEIPLTQGRVALVDDSDYLELSRHKWCVLKSTRRERVWYATRACVKNGKKTHVYMHREIMGFPDGLEIDHVDGDGLNNQRSNLRVATRSQNSANSIRKRKSKSGYTGVRLDPRFKTVTRYRAAIWVHGKYKTIGAYKTPEEAARAYDAEARKVFGEFAKLNFMEP